MTAGQLLRLARTEAGLSQAVLAERVGTRQPAVSRVEHDQVSPSVETLGRLIAATGVGVLEISIRRRP